MHPKFWPEEKWVYECYKNSGLSRKSLVSLRITKENNPNMYNLTMTVYNRYQEFKNMRIFIMHSFFKYTK